jgi:hypothetical protein
MRAFFRLRWRAGAIRMPRFATVPLAPQPALLSALFIFSDAAR